MFAELVAYGRIYGTYNSLNLTLRGLLGVACFTVIMSKFLKNWAEFSEFYEQHIGLGRTQEAHIFACPWKDLAGEELDILCQQQAYKVASLALLSVRNL